MGKNKSVIICIGVVVILVIIGLAMGTKNTDNKETNNNAQKTDSSLLDALRKCTVMEASDLYRDGNTTAADNVFDKAKETCLSWSKQMDEKTFIESNDADWENRKNEEIEGKTLEYFLSALGW